jgi:TIR domain
MPATKIFISHSHHDAKWANWIDVQLTKRGFQVWRDLTSIRPGQSFIAELNNAIQEADLMVVLMSPDYFSSAWARQETEFAAARKIPIIPVLIAPCEVQGLLGYYNWADLTKDRDKGLHRVIEAVEHLRGEPTE